jgi:hypothetical protein
MKPKSWIITGSLFLLSSSLWGAYVLSQRAFLRDFNAGVHDYLAGNYAEAEQSLKMAVERRPRNDQARQLLIKTFIERSFAQYHQKNYAAALATLDRASQTVSMDDDTRQTLSAMREQLSVPAEQRPVNMEKVLDGLYRRLPDKTQPNNLQTLMEQWMQRSQANQELLLKRFWDNQERWLVQLQREKEQFKKILYGGLILFGLGGVVLIVLLMGVLHAYFGRRGVFARLLDDHYRRLVAALPAGSQVLLGPPISLHHVPESQQMDVIEAEISSGQGAEESARRLQSLLEGENPWVRARAAKILYPLDQKTALQELKRLVTDASSGSQVPGMWALTELATEESLDLLVPLAYSPSREIQQGAIRSLVQLQSKEDLAVDVREKLNHLLPEIRSRTGWIF